MSRRVRARLTELNIEGTTHEERVALDLEIERITGGWCDDTVGQLTEEQFRAALAKVQAALKGKSKPKMLWEDERSATAEQTVSQEVAQE